MMNDNDILIARKTEGGCKTAVIDGEVADFDRINNRIKGHRDDEEAEKRDYEAYLKHMHNCQKKKADAEFARRRRQVYLTFGLVLSVGGLMALTLTGLMHTVVGMAFIAGAAAVLGWMLGRNH